jgi:hypothetical protein
MSHDFAPEGCPARLNRPILGPQQESVMAKGQQRSNKEARKPKKAKVKTNASQPSQKGGVRGLENMKND